MSAAASVLLVDDDRPYAHALALLLRRNGHTVRVAHTRHQALHASLRGRYDLAIVDLFLRGGGGDLARVLSARVGKLLLSLAPQMGKAEVLEAAFGFPVLRKATLPGSLKGRRFASARRRPRAAGRWSGRKAGRV